MAGLSEFRKQHPQYNDMSDADLSDALYRKFYGDMPREQFDERMGATQAEPAVQPSAMEVGTDVAKSLGSGVARGAAMVAGLPGDVSSGMGWLVEKAADKLFGEKTPEQRAKGEAVRQNAVGLATTEDVTSAAHSLTGMSLPEPQTTAGEYARTVGEFVPTALAPGGHLTRIARPLLSGIGSEAAGQAAQEYAPGLEPYARIAGSIPGGLATAGRSPMGAAAKGAPSAQALKQQTDDLYGQLRQAGIQYDPAAFNSMVVRTESEMVKQGLRPSVAKEAFDYIQDLAKQTGGIDFDDINGLVITAGKAARGATRAGNNTLAEAFGIIRDNLDDFEEAAPLLSASNLPRDQINQLRKTARQAALQNIKQRALDDVFAKADTYTSGLEAGIRNGINNLLRSKKGQQLFKGAEREALLEASQGRKLLQTLSRFGYDLTSVNGNASFLPTFGALGAGALFGPLAGAGLAAAGSGAKVLSPALTKRAFEQASAAVRSGALRTAPRLPPYFTPIQSGVATGLIGARGSQMPR